MMMMITPSSSPSTIKAAQSPLALFFLIIFPCPFLSVFLGKGGWPPLLQGFLFPVFILFLFLNLLLFFSPSHFSVRASFAFFFASSFFFCSFSFSISFLLPCCLLLSIQVCLLQPHPKIQKIDHRNPPFQYSRFFPAFISRTKVVTNKS